jgi:uncharacterized protein (DUF4213/DUF364 family)
MTKSSLYEALICGLPEDLFVSRVCGGVSWIAALSGNTAGIAARFDGECDFGAFSAMPIRDAARAVLSDDQEAAGAGLAVINSYYNSAARLSELGARVSCETLCTDGMDTAGLTVGMVGRMRRTASALDGAKKVYIFELDPRDGDLPASEEERLIPECDLVIITGTAVFNHTLPHLLELSRGAGVILLGPSVPLCPALFDFGVNRLSGFSVTDAEGFMNWNANKGGSPMGFGDSFLLKRG